MMRIKRISHQGYLDRVEVGKAVDFKVPYRGIPIF